MSMKPDELSPPCRDFYEHALFKMTLSLVLAAFAMMFLGFTSQSGSVAQSNNILQDMALVNDDYAIKALQAQVSGFGFACFAFLIAFFITLSAALWVSPLLGSPNERKTLSSPQEFESLGRVEGSSASPYITPVQPGYGASQNPIITGMAPPVGAAVTPATVTYTVGATAAPTTVYSSTGYLSKEVYEAPSAPPMK